MNDRMDDLPGEDLEDGYENWLKEGKREVNDFLWTFLPPTTTLGEADSFACELYMKILDLWDASKK
jgi:hypothetical protein